MPKDNPASPSRQPENPENFPFAALRKAWHSHSAMMRLIFVLLVAAIAAIPTSRSFAQAAGQPKPAAQTAEKKPARPSPQFLRRGLQWLESTDAARRRAAYRSFMQLDAGAMPYYKKALDAAAKAHNKRLESLVAQRSTNPYLDHDEAARQLDDERARILPLIRTDYHKAPAKIKMLRTEMDGLGRLYDKTMNLARNDTSRFDAQLDGTVAALVEIARELERFDPERDSASMTDEELRTFVLEDNVDAQPILKQRERLEASRKEAADLAAARRDNAAAGRWASPAMRTFVGILNQQRAWLGLSPLRLEEHLSAAAKGHSKDMATIGFFAHTSPVKGKETSGKRARLAGFTGQWTGENIYLGSTEPAAAFSAWFGSDGHRFIMFASGPNVIGIGIHGRHWTLMTGRL